MSQESPSVAILAYSPAPYRVELFDEIARRGRIRLTGLYVHRQEPGRLWSEAPMAHEAVFLQEDAAGKARQTVQEADLVAISFFDQANAQALWKCRIASGRPWTFWGEKPGAHRRNLAGRLLRRWRMRDLAASDAPVWCMGSWAEAAYRAEFGQSRVVANLPYFSDLSRFARAAESRPKSPETCRILYSGNLSHRKGVDVLQRAYAQASMKCPGLTLTYVCGSPWEGLPALYAGHDVLAVPSRYDGWGMVVPEGLASGMPVICSDQVGAGHDLVKSGINGWICQAGSVEALSCAIQEAGRLSVNEWQAMSAAASASVANHQLSDGAERLESLCFEALAGRKAGSLLR